MPPTDASEMLTQEDEIQFGWKEKRNQLSLLEAESCFKSQIRSKDIQLKSRINVLVGKNITKVMQNEEANSFRRKYIPYCEHIGFQRNLLNWERRAIYAYPPEFIRESDFGLVKERFSTNHKIKILAYVDKCKYLLTVNHDAYPIDVVQEALKLHDYAREYNCLDEIKPTDPADYVLKVHGKLTYFLGETSGEVKGYRQQKLLILYKHVYEHICNRKLIKVRVVTKSYLNVPCMSKGIDPWLGFDSRHDIDKAAVSLWDLRSNQGYDLHIIRIYNGCFPQEMKLQAVCSINHGIESLCKSQKTSLRCGVDPEFKEKLSFDIDLSQLPRMSKLCISVIAHEKLKTKIVAWMNIPLFDHDGYLRSGEGIYNCRLESESGSLSKYITVPFIGEDDSGMSIEICFMESSWKFRFPTEKEILAIPADISHKYQAKQHKSTVEEIIRSDPISSLSDDEKELLWQFRNTFLQDYPNSLPKLVQCVKWGKADHVVIIHHLIANWKVHMVSIDTALALLHYRYPDILVRSFAVKVLETLTDYEVEIYLVQLIQGLKFEMYVESSLAVFLLKRALNNRNIGHYLFWHLKAEISRGYHSIQLCLVLEMYCHGALEHLPILEHQVEAMNKLKTFTDILQTCTDTDRPEHFKELLKRMFEGDGAKLFSNLLSPTNPTILFKRLKIECCKFMTSAKKPLWLVFENADTGADDTAVIFKNGDDLRQDMLSLSSLKLMDGIWKDGGDDYGLIPYSCLSTGPMTGLIEVVPESETLCRIQHNVGTIRGVLKEDCLYMWLQEHCSGDVNKFNDNIVNFTLSVVAYSVAMYVLGVGDRHNDNIMMKIDTGQLFHIDFGHFLGHFKSKFGIRRERVKFILPKEFIYIIERTNKDKTEEENFLHFKNMCVNAFLNLRRKGSTILTTFAMLMQAGLPELQRHGDLEYLRDTLALHKDEKEAEVRFGEAFQEAYDKRDTTTMNFVLHNVKQFWI